MLLLMHDPNNGLQPLAWTAFVRLIHSLSGARLLVDTMRTILPTRPDRPVGHVVRTPVAHVLYDPSNGLRPLNEGESTHEHDHRSCHSKPSITELFHADPRQLA